MGGNAKKFKNDKSIPTLNKFISNQAKAFIDC